MSPVIRKEHKEILIHTGQHYDDNRSAVFFRELGLPQPDYVLNGNGGACAEGYADRVTAGHQAENDSCEKT